MFDPREETMVLEMVRGFFDISAQDMMKIGDLTKQLLFNPGACSEEEAASEFREALQEMPKEHVFMAGMFASGLLRCNLAQQIEECTGAGAEGEPGAG